MNADNYWRQRMERDRVLRRWCLQKLARELEVPGKRDEALSRAQRWFGVTNAEGVQALLDAMPRPRTTPKRGEKGQRRRMLREQDVGSWSGHSVTRQHAAGVGNGRVHICGATPGLSPPTTHDH
jgi:hypothetical protein